MLENLTDTEESFVIERPLVGNGELGRRSDIPEQATADMTLRRIQKLALEPGEPCAWKFVRDGKVLQEDDQKPDEHGLLTTPRVVAEASAGRLQVEAKWIF